MSLIYLNNHHSLKSKLERKIQEVVIELLIDRKISMKAKQL